VHRTVAALIWMVASSCSRPPAPRPEPTPLAPPTEEPAEEVTGDSLAPEAALLAERFAAIQAATVAIEGWAPYLGWRRVGSGAVVSADGLVLTALHVVDAPGRYRTGARPLRVVATDPARDLAVLDAGAPFDAHLALSDRPVEEGAWLVCAGYPGRAAADPKAFATLGLAADVDHAWRVSEPELSFEHMLDSACGSAPGMSGGPVVDLDGALVGVIVGAGGVVSPVALASALPPRIAPRIARRIARRVSPRPAAREAAPFERDEVGRPSRHRTLLAGAVTARRAARSVVGLTSPSLDFEARGVVIEGGRVLTTAEVVAGGAPELLREDGEPLATEIVAVRGELALLRVPGAPDLVPLDAEPARPEVGATVVTARWNGPLVGVVTDDARQPGVVDAPPLGDRGCGWLRGQARRENPPIELGRVFAHDTLGFVRGALLVDRHGHPLGIDVASADDDLHYAIPFADALARFE